MSASVTLSRVQAWDTQHLTEAAAEWANTATVWEEAFVNLSARIPAPGGNPWSGDAADAAVRQADADRLTVTTLADQLVSASAIARAGSHEIDAAKHRVLAAVSAAEAMGFTVGEDFSVADSVPQTGAAASSRQLHAERLAADIRNQLTELITADRNVAAGIVRAAADVGALPFGGGDADVGSQTIHAVDHYTVKEGPPQPEPPDPSPGPLPPVTNADDVKRVLDPLPNGGKRGPNGVGTKPGVAEVWDENAMRQLWDYLTRNATNAEGPPGFKGPVRRLLDGTKMGFRPSTQGWGDTIDVWYPDGSENKKVHTPYAPYFPSIAAPPQSPPLSEPAVAPNGPWSTGHAPVTLPPTAVFDPNGLPPWLQDPSTPGIHQPNQAPTIMPGVAVPDAPTYVTTPDEAGLFPNLDVDLAEAGKTAGAEVLGGLAVIGGLIAPGVTPSGQIAR